MITSVQINNNNIVKTVISIFCNRQWSIMVIYYRYNYNMMEE